MIRMFDIVFSGLALLALSPILLPIMLILRVTGEGEIFYPQERVGLGGLKFNVYKFATMLKDSPNIGTGTMTVKHDPRILPIGGFLRKTKVNELPQLLNILFGHMSLVGPRPLTDQTFSVYDEHTRKIISGMRPGLSGVGSLVFRNEEDILDGADATTDFYNKIISPYKGSLEVWYANNAGVRTYFFVIFATIWAVFFPRTRIVWKGLRGLPRPSSVLIGPLNYVDND